MVSIPKNTRKNGITLIALVITIIVLLILAGISISMLAGNNSLLNRATQSKKEFERTGEEELIKLAISGAMIKNKSSYFDEASFQQSLQSQTNRNFDIYTTQGKLRVAFLDNNAYYDIDKNGNIVYIGKSINGLDIGDLVTYTPPEASYLLKRIYSGEEKDENEDTELDETEISNTDSNYSITSWRVLNINGSTVDLVANNQTTGKLYLSNPQGYNNGVKLLNEMCNALYSNEEKGITARSINIEDFEDKFKKETFDSIAEYTSVYNEKIAAYYNKQQYAPCRSIYSKYPNIYAEEYKSVINGITKNDGLKRSEQNNLVEPQIGEETDWKKIGRITDVTSIQPYLTVYTRSNDSLKNDFKKQIYYDMLIRSNSYYTSYWLASRGVWAGDWEASFQLYTVIHGKLTSKTLYTSYGDGRNESYYLLPIITVNTELLKEVENTDNWIIK